VTLGWDGAGAPGGPRQGQSPVGIWLLALGRPAGTLPGALEAAALFRELFAVSPDWHRPDLAASPGNLADVLLALKRGRCT
jgi:hypothetical protein